MSKNLFITFVVSAIVSAILYIIGLRNGDIPQNILLAPLYLSVGSVLTIAVAGATGGLNFKRDGITLERIYYVIVAVTLAIPITILTSSEGPNTLDPGPFSSYVLFIVGTVSMLAAMLYRKHILGFGPPEND